MRTGRLHKPDTQHNMGARLVQCSQLRATRQSFARSSMRSNCENKGVGGVCFELGFELERCRLRFTIRRAGFRLSAAIRMGKMRSIILARARPAMSLLARDGSADPPLDGRRSSREETANRCHSPVSWSITLASQAQVSGSYPLTVHSSSRRLPVEAARARDSARVRRAGSSSSHGPVPVVFSRWKGK